MRQATRGDLANLAARAANVMSDPANSAGAWAGISRDNFAVLSSSRPTILTISSLWHNTASSTEYIAPDRTAALEISRAVSLVDTIAHQAPTILR